MEPKELQPSEVNCIIYHHPCSDGFASALALWKYAKLNNLDNITFIPANHGDTPPDVTGKNVLIADFSYKKYIINKLIEQANKLLIIDHHNSAEKELSEIPDKYKIFDMNHSGAMLTWLYFFPDSPVPKLIKYIEDRDIWKKEYSDCDAFVAWFYLLPFEFEIYNEYLDDNLLTNMINIKGKSFQELNNINIKQASNYACPVFCKIQGKYYFVAYLNTTGLKSDIGNEIFNVFPYIDFSAVYSSNDWNNSTSFSLRSTMTHADVSEISTSIGGGGHRNASGVRVNCQTTRLPSISYDNGQLYNLLPSIYFQDYKDYKIVYMFSNSYKTKLAKYLLQTKYKNKSGEDVQEAVFINNTRDGNNKNFKVNMSVILSYDGYKDETEYVIWFDELVSEEERKSIIKPDNKLIGFHKFLF